MPQTEEMIHEDRLPGHGNALEPKPAWQPRYPGSVRLTDKVAATMSKAKRKGGIFIDWLRNRRGGTAILPYSARARAGAPVAVPVGWEELKDIEAANHFSIRDMPDLVERSRSKTLKGWGFTAQSLPESI